MKHGKIVNIQRLARIRSEEIEEMERGIRGDAEGVLWTAELRAATRGGKPCGLSSVEENDSSVL